MRLKILLAAAVITFSPASLSAHETSRSVLHIEKRANEFAGRLDFSLRDLENLFGLDTDEDNKITWGEVLSSKERILAYISGGIHFTRSDKECTLRTGQLMIERYPDGAYLAAPFNVDCSGQAPDEVTYNLFFATDPQHRVLVKLSDGTKDDMDKTLTSEQRTLNLRSTKISDNT